MSAAVHAGRVPGGEATAGAGAWHRWWHAFRRLVPFAALYALLVGAKDLPFVAAINVGIWSILVQTFLGEFMTALMLFACVAVVDISSLQGRRRAIAYVAAAFAGTIAGVMVVVPSYFVLGVWDGRHTFGEIAWANMQAISEVLIAIILYRLWERRRQRTATLRALRLERADVLRATAASNLQAMQARIDPAFLLDSMTAVERMHATAPAAGERLLDDLVAYLRAALPEISRSTSTIGKECDLAQAYLDIVRIRDGLDLTIAIYDPGSLREAAFPPMVVLPLVEALLAALRASRIPTRVHVQAGVATGGVCLALDIAPGLALDRGVIARVRTRLHDVDGAAASLVESSTPEGGTHITVEIPDVRTTRADR